MYDIKLLFKIIHFFLLIFFYLILRQKNVLTSILCIKAFNSIFINPPLIISYISCLPLLFFSLHFSLVFIFHFYSKKFHFLYQINITKSIVVSLICLGTKLTTVVFCLKDKMMKPWICGFKILDPNNVTIASGWIEERKKRKRTYNRGEKLQCVSIRRSFRFAIQKGIDGNLVNLKQTTIIHHLHRLLWIHAHQTTIHFIVSTTWTQPNHNAIIKNISVTISFRCYIAICVYCCFVFVSDLDCVLFIMMDYAGLSFVRRVYLYSYCVVLLIWYLIVLWFREFRTRFCSRTHPDTYIMSVARDLFRFSLIAIGYVRIVELPYCVFIISGLIPFIVCIRERWRRNYDFVLFSFTCLWYIVMIHFKPQCFTWFNLFTFVWF